MNIGLRIIIFVVPVLMAVIWKYTIVAAENGDELKLIVNRPAKMFDLSIDLALVAFSILLGMLLYTYKGGVFRNPTSGKDITAMTVLGCALVQIAAIFLIFALVLAGPHVPGLQQHLDLVTIWVPDLIALVALIVIVFKLT